MIEDTPTRQPMDDENAQPQEVPADLTVDLDLDGSEADFDLQALADQVAESTPDRAAAEQEACPPAPAPAPEDEVAQLLNSELERSLDEAMARIQELERHEAEAMDKHHRLLADFANYRSRTARDIQMAVDQAERKLLLEVLPVLDNFERCLGATYRTVEDFHAGVELIRKQFLDALRRVGAEPIALNVGDPFDAAHAEALSTTSAPGLPDSAVAAIYERGYTLRDQLLRAARVVVNRAPEGDAAE